MFRYGLIALIAMALPAAADIYKWVDESGKVNYSDQPPPPNAKAVEHVKEPATAQPRGDATPAAAPNSAAELEMEFRKRQAEREKAEAEGQAQLRDAETKRKNCEQARNYLAGLNVGSRMNKYGPDGERIYLTDEEYADAIVKAQASVDSRCK